MSSTTRTTGSGGGGGGGPSTSSSQSASQQANDMTRNFILGLPREGVDPNSEEAADLRAAEAFVSDIQQEILAYDVANARAVEAYARRWWSRVPYFGRHARQAIALEEAEEAAAQAQAAAQQEKIDSSSAEAADATGGALRGLDAAAAAEAAAAAGGAYLHTQKGKTSRGLTVERTAAVDAETARKLAAAASSSSGAQGPAGTKRVYSTNQTKVNTWLFKRNHPGWVPLLQRWWVPWVCVGLVGLIWTPDVWKLRTLYALDYQYAELRRRVHVAYWRATMDPEDFQQLMADIEASRPPSVKSTDCPF